MTEFFVLIATAVGVAALLVALAWVILAAAQDAEDQKPYKYGENRGRPGDER